LCYRKEADSDFMSILINEVGDQVSTHNSCRLNRVCTVSIKHWEYLLILQNTALKTYRLQYTEQNVPCCLRNLPKFLRYLQPASSGITLMMAVEGTSEMSVSFHQTTWPNIPEDSYLERISILLLCSNIVVMLLSILQNFTFLLHLF
jgi:hypothetical protein